MFGYHVESPGRQTWRPHRFLREPFGYRAGSPGRQTAGKRLCGAYGFGYRAGSPGRRTVAGETAGLTPDQALGPDEKRRYSCFVDPGREVSRPMRISAGVDFRPNDGMLAFARMEYVTAATPFRQRARLFHLVNHAVRLPSRHAGHPFVARSRRFAWLTKRPAASSNHLVVKRSVARTQPASRWVPCRIARSSI